MELDKKEEILERVEKASSEEYETSWDDKGVPVSKSKINIQQGKNLKNLVLTLN